MTWQTIDSAPKDGTEIIAVHSSDYGYQDAATVYGPWTVAFRGGKWMASWDGSPVIESEGYWGTDHKVPDMDPTHWKPLPPPPGDGE